MQSVPYPTDPAAEAELLEHLARQFIPRAADELDATPPVFEFKNDERDRLQTVAKTAAELVTKYLGTGNTCPQSVKDEAAIRAIGWMIERPSYGLTAATHWSGSSRTYDAKGCLRGSGAMSILSPFKERRAGVISNV